MMRHCLALDLKTDPELIQLYEAFHRGVWPEVLEHLREQGVVAMEIFRLGTRLVMIMETDDARFDPERMAAAEKANPRVREWEALMWTLQAPTPWTPAGKKWTPMTGIFDLRNHPVPCPDHTRVP
jgi:L-rhamnose mutarotase